MGVELFRFSNSRGLWLSAALHGPLGEWRQSWVILSHGMLSTKDSRKHTELSERLAGLGFPVLRFDFSGQGASEGEPWEITYGNGVDDLLCASRELFRRGAERFLLIGSSMGSGVSILASKMLKEKVVGLALMASVTNCNLIYESLSEADRNIWEERGTFYFEERPVGFSHVEDARDHDLTAALSAFTGPALFIHGREDELIPAQNLEAFSRLSGGKTDLIVVDGADHRFSQEAHRLRLIEEVALWAARNIP